MRRKLAAHDRLFLQQADQAIRKDLVRALIELITNSNDSYSRAEASGQEVSGEIVVCINRKFSGTVLRVADFAEGMDAEQMDDAVGTYAAPTSGFEERQNVRGLWGRGLKDAILGLGEGNVASIKGGKRFSCRLSLEKHQATYERDDIPQKATSAIRHQFGVKDAKTNSTQVEIAVTRSDITIPQFEALRRNLEHHYELRFILMNPNRSIILRKVNDREQIQEEIELEYKSPVGTLLLEDEITVPGCPTTLSLPPSFDSHGHKLRCNSTAGFSLLVNPTLAGA